MDFFNAHEKIIENGFVLMVVGKLVKNTSKTITET